MHDKLGVCAKRRGIVAGHGVDVTDRGVIAELGVVAEWCGVVTKLGIVVTKRAPSGVASLPRMASSPECGVIAVKRAPSGVALLPSGVVLSPECVVVVIVAAINDRVAAKRCFVCVGSASRGDSKREQVPPVRQ